MTILLATLVGSSRAIAQIPVRRTAVWGGAAIGATRPYDWAIVGSVAVRHARVLVRTRYAITFESPGGRVDDVGLLVGVVVTPPSARPQLSLGVGWGRVRQVYNCFLCSGPRFPPTDGVLLDAEGRVALGRKFGFTAYAFGNVNSRLSFGGLALGLFVGGP